LAIFAGVGFAFLAVAGGTKIGGRYASLPGLAWVGLFCSLGFNFLQWGWLDHPIRRSTRWAARA
jgi:hypothetical protein